MANMEYYKTFMKVAELGNMTVASKEMNISQPAVTQTIKNLERDLGWPLFLRTARSLELTAEGKMLYERLKPAMNIIENAEAEFGQYNKLNKGEVRIGVSTMLTKILLLDKLKKFNELYPGIKLTIENGLTSHSLYMLRRGLLDIVIYSKECNCSAEGQFLDLKPLADLDYAFIYNPDYFECPAQTKLIEYPFVLQKENSAARETVNSFFVKHGMTPNIVAEVVSNELVVELVAKGLGIGCVYEKLAALNGKVKSIKYESEPISTRIYAATHQDMTPTAAAKAFMKVLNEK